MTLNISNLQLEGKNIVIVEDDIPSVRYYETLLRNSGANVKILNTGKQFIDYLNCGNPAIDLVFMDFLIPIVNGIECARYFRKERKTTPVVMITAYSSEQAKTEAYIAGCNEYVLKPIYPEKIFFLIEKYLYSNIPVSNLY
jgi:two-component system response regulator CpxR